MKSDINIQKIVLACMVKAGTGANAHYNRPSHGLALFPGGKRFFDFGNKRVRADGKCIVYFPKGSSYSINTAELTDCYAVNFELGNNQIFEPFAFTIEHTENYISNYKSIINLWDRSDASDMLKIKSELYDIIYKIHREYKSSSLSKPKSIIQPAIDYISENYTKENIFVEKLAQMCSCSEVYLRKMFSREFGMSPNRYIKQMMLKRAEELLLSGIYKVNDVALLSGFNNEGYFNREFKKYYGKPPKEYAKLRSITNKADIIL